MNVSILIPVKKDNKYLRECIENCLALEYSDFEIIVLPDEDINPPYKDRIRVIPTGSTNPGKKRDMVIKDSKGEILAFLDDDAFPKRDWLMSAIRNFDDKNVAAVCGPAVTPENDTLNQKASGLVYSSKLVSGRHIRRYAPQDKCEVDDYPSCNFLVRKEIFKQLGGFDTNFWPGEDTILCLKITKELKKKIVYDPAVLVYHHRRPLFLPHLRQIKSYALHRGYFVKRFPATSLKFSYFIPTIFVFGLISGLFLIFMPAAKFLYLGIIGLYLILNFFDSFVRQDSLRLRVLVFFGIMLTHLTYGVYFIKGLFSRRLSDE